MSLNYAEQLSYREEIGTVGQTEFEDSDAVVEAKCKQLAEMIAKANGIVAMTGAGISTSCGIPDFRGPNGVWTCQKLGRPLPKLSTTFSTARPSYTHMALVELARAGKLRFVISQNVDGLHARSGLGPSQLAELHGNCFAERCPACNAIFVRDFEMNSVGFKPTGRSCSTPGCGGRLRDFILDWEDALPEDQLQKSEAVAGGADVMLCLGTSLQIRPVCQIPLITKRAGGRIAIVNLQKTPKHRSAALAVHARCDRVMRAVMGALATPVRPFVRWDRVQLTLFRGAARDDGSGGLESDVYVRLSSVHGLKCPLPLVAAVTCRWHTPPPDGAPEAADRSPPPETHSRAADERLTGPLSFKAALPLGRARLTLQLQLTDAADAEFRALDAPLELQVASLPEAVVRRGLPVGASCVHTHALAFVTQVTVYEPAPGASAEADAAHRAAVVEEVWKARVLLEGPFKALTLPSAEGTSAAGVPETAHVFHNPAPASPAVDESSECEKPRPSAMSGAREAEPRPATDGDGVWHATGDGEEGYVKADVSNLGGAAAAKRARQDEDAAALLQSKRQGRGASTAQR